MTKTEFKTGDTVLVDGVMGDEKRIFLYIADNLRYVVQREEQYRAGRIFNGISQWKNVRPVPRTETRVKSALALMILFAEQGYTTNYDGSWSKGSSYFRPGMWYFCGKIPEQGLYGYLPEWLEEVGI